MTEKQAETQEQPAEELISIPKSKLDERLTRAKESALKEVFKDLGLSKDEIKSKIEELNALKSESEKQKLAEMTEIERLKKEFEITKSEKEKLENDARSYAKELEIVSLCHDLGLKNKDYVKFKVANFTSENPKAKFEEIKSFVTELLKDEMESSALGVKAEKKTVDTQKSLEKPQSNVSKKKSVLEMTAEEYRDYKREKGLL